MKTYAFFCLSAAGLFLAGPGAGITTVDPSHPPRDTAAVTRLDALNVDRAKSFEWCAAAIADARNGCMTDCEAIGTTMTDFDGGFCGIGAKCVCDISVEQPPNQ